MAKKRKSIIAYNEDGQPVMEVFSLELQGDQLVMDGKALDSMRMDVYISIDEIAQGMDIVLTKDVFKFAFKLPGALLRNRKKKQQMTKED